MFKDDGLVLPRKFVPFDLCIFREAGPLITSETWSSKSKGCIYLNNIIAVRIDVVVGIEEFLCFVQEFDIVD